MQPETRLESSNTTPKHPIKCSAVPDTTHTQPFRTGASQDFAMAHRFSYEQLLEATAYIFESWRRVGYASFPQSRPVVTREEGSPRSPCCCRQFSWKQQRRQAEVTGTAFIASNFSGFKLWKDAGKLRWRCTRDAQF